MDRQPTGKNLVTSLCIGRTDVFRFSQPFQKAYADKYGHDFHVIDKEYFRALPNRFKKRRVRFHMEKFQVYELLNEYDRILFLDADVMPTSLAPDLFAMVAPGNWGCVREPRGDNDRKFRDELCAMARKLEKLPADSWKSYFNSGVMVFDRSHRSIWEWHPDEVISGRWPEQTLLNYRMIRSAMPVTELDLYYNYTPQSGPMWYDAESRRKAFFIHYAGEHAKKYLTEDIEYLQLTWGLSP